MYFKCAHIRNQIIFFQLLVLQNQSENQTVSHSPFKLSPVTKVLPSVPKWLFSSLCARQSRNYLALPELYRRCAHRSENSVSKVSQTDSNPVCRNVELVCAIFTELHLIAIPLWSPLYKVTAKLDYFTGFIGMCTKGC